MPIRTSRGRGAVYRALWGWPLRSPRHLGVSVVLAAVLGWLVVLPLPSGPAEDPAANRPPAGSGENQFDPDARRAAAGSTEAPEAPPAALSVADAWMRAFLSTPEGITNAAWTEQLRPYSTEAALTELTSVDPANVPDGQVTGTPRTVSARIGSAEVDVPSSSAVVRLKMVTTAQGWRVAGYDRSG